MRDKIISGTLWSSFNLLVSRGLQFVVKLILARLLLPEHFGIVGMAVVFTSVISVLGEMGLSAALIRSRDDEISATHFHTAFWASIAFNLLIYLIIALGLAPFAAWFYGEDILRLVLPVLGLSVVIMPFSLIPRIILTRSLNFKRLNLIQIIPTIISGAISITMALMGFGVWSIVVHGLAAAALTVPVYWLSVSWRPKPVFSKQALRQILGFGVYDTMQNTLVTLTKNIDYLIIGKIVGAAPLGYYTLAFTLTDTFRQQIMGILNKVMFPIYGKVQTDIPKVKKYYLSVVRLNTAVTAGVMMVLFLYAEPIIHIVFGERWLPAVFPIKMMAIAGVIHAIGGTSASVLKALGYFNIQLKITVYIVFFIMIPGFITGTHLFGINGAAVVVVLGKLAGRVFGQYYMKKHIGVTDSDIFNAVKPSIYGLSTGFAAFFFLKMLFSGTSRFELVASGTITFFVYSLILLLLLKDDVKAIMNKTTKRIQH